MVRCMMVRAMLMASFLLMLAITLNARVIQEQGGQEEMSRDILHDIKQGSIGDGDIDQMKKEILALLLNDHEAKAQAASHLQSLFEGDLDLPQEEIDNAYGTTGKPIAAKAQAAKYFEGDLKLPKEIIKNAYGIKSSEAEIQKATSKNTLWKKGIVYYDYDKTVSKRLMIIIRGAMDEYEQHTCLKFKFRYPADIAPITEFIRFQSILGCYSNWIGEKTWYDKQHIDRDMQVINIEDRPYCASHDSALHEIGHAIGFWHEQSRPDRDNYLTIHWNHIDYGKSQFLIRQQVDYQDEKYDYASVMHYSLNSASYDDDDTMEINNFARYKEQGQPDIGHYSHLSEGDIRLVNKMYKCYNQDGQWGYLFIHVTKVTGLPIGKYNAEITAYGKNSMKRYTTNYYQHAANTRDIVFHDALIANEGHWRYFELRIKNRLGKDVIGRQTIWVTSPAKEQRDDSYCVRDKCVYFTYEIL